MLKKEKNERVKEREDTTAKEREREDREIKRNISWCKKGKYMAVTEI